METIRRVAIPLWRILALIGLMAALIPTTSVAAQSDDVESAAADLTQATLQREGAEKSLDELFARRRDIQSRLDAVSADTQDITAQVAIARSQMIDSAVAAYVAGGTQEQLSAVLMASDIHDVSDRVNFMASQTSRLSETVAEYDALRRSTAPEIVALAEELESVERSIVEAQDALAGARAAEADAERFLTEAEAEAAAASVVPATVVPSPTSTDPTTTTSSSTVAPTVPTTLAPPPTLVTKPAPPPSIPPSGPTPEQWAKLRECESGGNYQIVSRSGRYRGAYQFDQRTWESVGGVGDPAAAPPAEQDLRAQILYAQRGASAWPHCGKYLR